MELTNKQFCSSQQVLGFAGLHTACVITTSAIGTILNSASVPKGWFVHFTP